MCRKNKSFHVQAINFLFDFKWWRLEVLGVCFYIYSLTGYWENNLIIRICVLLWADLYFICHPPYDWFCAFFFFNMISSRDKDILKVYTMEMWIKRFLSSCKFTEFYPGICQKLNFFLWHCACNNLFLDLLLFCFILTVIVVLEVYHCKLVMNCS